MIGIFDDADLVHTCSRGELLASGQLIAIDEATRREAGIPCPVALTQAAHATVVALTDAAARAGCDERGRTWDLLTMLRWAFNRILRERPGKRIAFEMMAVVERVRPRRVVLVAVGGIDDDGERPVVTVMLPTED